jgi:hypothetical protein
MSRSRHTLLMGPSGKVFSNRNSIPTGSTESLHTMEKKVNKALKFGMSKDSPFLKKGITEVHPATKNLSDDRKAMFSKLIKEGSKSPELQ